MGQPSACHWFACLSSHWYTPLHSSSPTLDRLAPRCFAMPNPNAVPPAAGYVLVETINPPTQQRSRYALTRLHGEGGLGRVYVAHDGDLNRDVALKEIRPDQAQHPEMWRRFLKEAQITGQLEHPNIV